MSLVLSVKTNFPDVQRKLASLQRDIGDKAVVMALNKAADKGRAEMTRAITTEFNIKADEVRSSLYVRRASRKGLNLTAVLEAFGSTKKSGRSLNLIHFLSVLANQSKTRGSRAKKSEIKALAGQLGFTIKRGGGIKHIAGSFLGNRWRTVFMRTGDKRLPIVPVQAIGVPQMFNTKRINNRVVSKILQEFPIEFDRAMRLVFERAR